MKTPRLRSRIAVPARGRRMDGRATTSHAGACTAPLRIADGTLEALKWIAMALMTLDHVNKYLLLGSWPALYALGRLALPIFAFVLAYNLARPGAFEQGVHLRVIRRLGVFGLLATPAFTRLVGWWPLNVLFLLLAMTAIAAIVERGGRRACCFATVVFLVGGALVEFWWFGLLYGLASWRYCRSPTWARGLQWAATTLLLGVVNGNVAALAAIPLLLAAPHVPLTTPRMRWLAYGFYPLHLSLIAWVQAIR